MSDTPAGDPVDPATLAERIDAGDPVRLLDVRNRDEFETWRIDGPSVTATQIPHMKWISAQATGTVADLAADVDGEGPITVVCGHGEASDAVADALAGAGVEARNLAGGMRGWARVYQATELPTDGATVVQYRRPASGCLSYVVVSDGEAAVVDPLRAFVDRYVADAADRDAEITTAFDTHVHADHVSGLRELADAAGVTPTMPRFSAQRGAEFDAETVVDGETLAVGEATLDLLHLPGHTTGMTAVLVDGVLLSGDSLFVESVARPDLQRGADGAEPLAAQLHESLTERLADLPDETLVAPGHFSSAATPAEDGSYTARLGDLRERLPAFGTDRAEFVARVLRDMPPRPANFEDVVATNLGLAEHDDEAAFEMELGPNNCAATPSLSD